MSISRHIHAEESANRLRIDRGRGINVFDQTESITT